MPTIYISIKDELLEENDSGLVSVQMKCPELRIKINQIDVIALVDTGSSVNGISEGWFNAHEAQLGSFEMLSISNTFIISAVGHKSKHIKKQILCDIEVNNIKTECVFLIIPGLVRDCIIGMNFLQQEGCVINIPENYINFVKQQKEPKGEEQHSIVPIFTVTTEGKDIKSSIDKKLKEINGVEPRYLDQLKEILLANTQVFDDRPGRIRGYYHTFSVTDNTPYIQKGWPVPLAYQRAVDDEIRRMLEFGVIERANSPYINPLVTVIKKDGKVRLCLDATKLNSVTVPDFEGPPPINEILARCGQMNIMSTIDLKSKFWQIPLQEECRNYTGFLYNGKLGNVFRIFVRERHTMWVIYIKLIESCLNEIGLYQDTIEVTPFEAHFGIKPKRQWEKFLDPCAVNEDGVNLNKIYLRIKEKGRRQAERLNQNHTLTEFKTGDKVLVKAYHMSDAARNIISKFCELYEGPYFIKKKLGRASYQLTLCEDQNKVRGIFNARQLKLYHSHNSS